MKSKVIIAIIAHKEDLSPQEKASLKQCHQVLGKYPIKLICPQGLNVDQYKKVVPNADFEFIDPKWQSNYRMFNRLKIEPLLYEKFKEYDHLLYYELDAWVFRDELEYWCEKPYDFIGAPWIEEVNNGKPEFYPVGGNGGMSLRNIKAHLALWTIDKKLRTNSEVLHDYRKLHGVFGTVLRFPFVIAKLLGYKNNVQYFLKTTALNEDIFWCREAGKFDPGFRVAPADLEYKFAFEKEPSLLYELNEKKLPFACHAWQKYDPEFWAQFIKWENT